jgi:hypothetical protein
MPAFVPVPPSPEKPPSSSGNRRDDAVRGHFADPVVHTILSAMYRLPALSKANPSGMTKALVAGKLPAGSSIALHHHTARASISDMGESEPARAAPILLCVAADYGSSELSIMSTAAGRAAWNYRALSMTVRRMLLILVE